MRESAGEDGGGGLRAGGPIIIGTLRAISFRARQSSHADSEGRSAGQGLPKMRHA